MLVKGEGRKGERKHKKILPTLKSLHKKPHIEHFSIKRFCKPSILETQVATFLC